VVERTYVRQDPAWWNLGPTDRHGVLLKSFRESDRDGLVIVEVVWARPTTQLAHADFLMQLRGVMTDLNRVADPEHVRDLARTPN